MPSSTKHDEPGSLTFAGDGAGPVAGPAGLPWSAAADRNKGPILEVLKQYFADRAHVLEVGSGTGQHAVHFGKELRQLHWDVTDLEGNLDGLADVMDAADLDNLGGPYLLDVADEDSWPSGPYDAIYTANTMHIMSEGQVQAFFDLVRAVATRNAVLVIYGPFNRDGGYTSPSNEEFDLALRGIAKHMGLRDIEVIDALAQGAGFRLVRDHAMPANNRCVVWKRPDTTE